MTAFVFLIFAGLGMAAAALAFLVSDPLQFLILGMALPVLVLVLLSLTASPDPAADHSQ